jgi:hypothetical protein
MQPPLALSRCRSVISSLQQQKQHKHVVPSTKELTAVRFSLPVCGIYGLAVGDIATFDRPSGVKTLHAALLCYFPNTKESCPDPSHTASAQVLTEPIEATLKF